MSTFFKIPVSGMLTEIKKFFWSQDRVLDIKIILSCMYRFCLLSELQECHWPSKDIFSHECIFKFIYFFGWVNRCSKLLRWYWFYPLTFFSGFILCRAPACCSPLSPVSPGVLSGMWAGFPLPHVGLGGWVPLPAGQLPASVPYAPRGCCSWPHNEWTGWAFFCAEEEIHAWKPDTSEAYSCLYQFLNQVLDFLLNFSSANCQ